MPSVDEFEEFDKHYRHTVIRGKTARDTEFLPMLVQSTDSDAKTLYLSHLRYGDLRYNWKSNSMEWDFRMPNRTLFSYKGHAGFFHRLPTRQWKRGLSEHTGKISWLTYSWRSHISPATAPHPGGFNNLALAAELYDPKFATFDKAVDRLMSFDTAEEILTPWFALTQSVGSDTSVLQLWHEDSVIGDVIPEDREILVRHTPLKEAVQQYITGRRLKWKVSLSPNESPT